jgi:hypothetical protein
MNPQDPNARPPLKNIEKSGTYVLKLCKPKDDKIYDRFKLNKSGFASCSLFFMDGDGNCVTNRYSAQWGKSLAVVIGKFSGKYCQTPSEQMSVEQLIKYCEPAFGKIATVEMEVTPNGEFNGKPQFKYKFTKITARDSMLYGALKDPSTTDDDATKPTAAASDESCPF